VILWWAILLTYVLGWLAFGLAFARDAKVRNIHRYGVYRAQREQGADLAVGLIAAILWPVLGPAFLIRTPLRRLAYRAMVTDIERQAARDEELVRLRQQARALGLPYPGGES
jgi:hypothetical protein